MDIEPLSAKGRRAIVMNSRNAVFELAESGAGPRNNTLMLEKRSHHWPNIKPQTHNDVDYDNPFRVAVAANYASNGLFGICRAEQVAEEFVVAVRRNVNRQQVVRGVH